VKAALESFITRVCSPASMMTISKVCSRVLAGGACALWLILIPAAPSMDVPGIVRQAKPAIVQIVSVDGKGNVKTGTGFFISADGEVLTNFHVIAIPVDAIDGSRIYAKTASGEALELKHYLYWSFDPDVALLDFGIKSTSFLTLGSSWAAKEGQRVLVIGNPEGLYGTVSDGIISAFRDNGKMIQITAPISPGSSGSPVLDENGQVIGIATLFGREGQNLNFAVSVTAIELMEGQYRRFSILSKLTEPLVEPEKSNLPVAESRETNAFRRLLGLLDTERQECLAFEQYLWNRKRSEYSKPGSLGFYNSTMSRALQLEELCQKYSEKE
jgi:hypothetical protein